MNSCVPEYDNKTVGTSGYVFARIIHEAFKSKNDTEGLIYGNIREHVKNIITDSQSAGDHQELQFALHDIVPFQKCFSFYNNLGNLVLDDEKQLDFKSFLGWYKVRRNTSCRISLREKTVIKNLLKILDLKKGLVFILLTPHCQENRSTYSFPYKCFLCQNDVRSADGVSLKIINLGHSGTHIEYRHQSSLLESANEITPISTIQPAMSKILSTFRGNFMREDGALHEVTHIHGMYQTTLKAMKEFQKSLLETNQQIEDCEKEIEELQMQIQMKNREDVTMIDEDRIDGNSLSRLRSVEHDDDSYRPLDTIGETLNK